MVPAYYHPYFDIHRIRIPCLLTIHNHHKNLKNLFTGIGLSHVKNAVQYNKMTDIVDLKAIVIVIVLHHHWAHYVSTTYSTVRKKTFLDATSTFLLSLISIVYHTIA